MSPFGPEFIAPGDEDAVPLRTDGHTTTPTHPFDAPELAQEVNAELSGRELEPAVIEGEIVTDSGPEPVLAGTFAIYADGAGGFVLVADTPTTGVQRRHIPAAIVKLVTGGGIVGRKFAGIFG